MISISGLTLLALYGCLGLIIGFLSSLLGIGGGILMVPTLLFIFQNIHTLTPDLAMHLAIGTSLTCITLISLVTFFTHSYRAKPLKDVYFKLAPGIFIGAFSGSLLSSSLSVIWLKKGLGLFLILYAMNRLLKNLNKLNLAKPRIKNFLLKIHPKKIKIITQGLMGYLIGFSSGLHGIGAGVLVVPYLSSLKFDMQKIIPISALCMLSAASISAIIFTLTGFHQKGLPLYAIGYIYWPAVINIVVFSFLSSFVGMKLSYFLSSRSLEFIFLLILFIISLHLLI